MESRFGFAIDFDRLTVAKAEQLQETITQNLNRIRRSIGMHTAERNPRYMELLTVQEGLSMWLQHNRRHLLEGEVGTAEVILAAKDMVDSIQDVIEKVGKMQNEQLPQLLDSIRDQIGSDQADGFRNSVGSTLDTLMQQLQTARDGVDGGVGILTGEQPTAMHMGNADMDAMSDGQDDSSMDDMMPQQDKFATSAAASGGTAPLGREQR